MQNKRIVTSVTSYKTEVGNILALTYREVDAGGNIIKRNAKVQKVVVDDEANAHIEALKTFAQSIVDEIEE